MATFDYMTEHQFRTVQDVNVAREVCENINWLVNATQEQKERLKNYLLNIDKANKVDLDSDRNQNVRQCVSEIVETIGRMITQRNPELKGRVVPMGSVNNGTKIGDLDEMDFAYEITHDALSHVDPTLMSPPDLITILQRSFITILGEVMLELKLPPGWCHGGFNRPHFSGPRFQGPSYLLQFEYQATSDGTPLRISVDFVSIIKLSTKKSRTRPLIHHNYFMRETRAEHCWWPLLEGGMRYGNAEELWLSKFPMNSTSKALIRIYKVFHRLVQMYSPKYPVKVNVQKIDSYVKEMTRKQDGTNKFNTELPSFRVKTELDFFYKYSEEDFISYSDLNENMGDYCMVRSHDMKTIVLHSLIATRELLEREWTDDDLPDLVISIYMHLIDATKLCWIRAQTLQDLPGIPSPELVKDEILIPVKHLGPHGETKKKLSLPTQSGDHFDKDVEELPGHYDEMEINKEPSVGLHHRVKRVPLKSETAAPVFYILTKQFGLLRHFDVNRYTSDMMPILHSQISAIFQLLRSICEGRDVAKVATLKPNQIKIPSPKLPGIVVDAVPVARKSDYKELLGALNSKTR